MEDLLQSNNRCMGAGLANYDHFFKILLVGDACVGKTSLLIRFCEETYSPTYLMTIGIDFRSKIVTAENSKIKLQLWDTAGQERYRTITQAYYRGSHGVLVVYDVTSRPTFEHVKRWLQEIQMQCGNVNLVLIGNKCDDPDAREVPTKEAKRFATNMKLPFYETSARDNINVEEAFTTMTKLALLAKKSQLLQRDSSWQSPVTKIGKDSGNSRLLSRLKRKHPCCK